MLFPLCLAWATIYNVISVIFHFSLFLYIYKYIYRARWSHKLLLYVWKENSSETREQRPAWRLNTSPCRTVILGVLTIKMYVLKKKKKFQCSNHSAGTISEKWRVDTAICSGYVLHLCISNFIFHLYCTKSLNKPVMTSRSDVSFFWKEPQTHFYEEITKTF